MRFLLLLLLTGCVTLAPTKADIRHAAGERLGYCLRVNESSHHDACLLESRIFCREHYLEPNCAIDDLWVNHSRPL